MLTMAWTAVRLALPDGAVHAVVTAMEAAVSSMQQECVTMVISRHCSAVVTALVLVVSSAAARRILGSFSPKNQLKKQKAKT